jgi:hypothetical protein
VVDLRLITQMHQGGFFGIDRGSFGIDGGAPSTTMASSPGPTSLSFVDCVSLTDKSGIDAKHALPNKLQQNRPQLAKILESSAVCTKLDIYARRTPKQCASKHSLWRKRRAQTSVSRFKCRATTGLLRVCAQQISELFGDIQ